MMRFNGGSRNTVNWERSYISFLGPMCHCCEEYRSVSVVPRVGPLMLWTIMLSRSKLLPLSWDDCGSTVPSKPVERDKWAACHSELCTKSGLTYSYLTSCIFFANRTENARKWHAWKSIELEASVRELIEFTRWNITAVTAHMTWLRHVEENVRILLLENEVRRFRSTLIARVRGYPAELGTWDISITTHWRQIRITWKSWPKSDLLKVLIVDILKVCAIRFDNVFWKLYKIQVSWKRKFRKILTLAKSLRIQDFNVSEIFETCRVY